MMPLLLADLGQLDAHWVEALLVPLVGGALWYLIRDKLEAIQGSINALTAAKEASGADIKVIQSELRKAQEDISVCRTSIHELRNIVQNFALKERGRR